MAEIQSTTCVVYWLHDEKCVCPWRHGYIGITSQLPKRLKNHRRKFRGGFDCEILFRGTLFACQQIEYQLRSVRNVGWNMGVGGGKNRLGVPHDENARRKMSKAVRPPISSEAREKLRLASTGRTNKGRIGQEKPTEERAKIAASKTGKKLSLEHCASIGRSKLGNKNRLGGTLSAESRAKISAKKRGVPIHSEETKRLRAERWKGNALTKGKPWSAARRLAWLQSKGG